MRCANFNLLVDAYEDYSCFDEVIFFCPVEGFKMEQTAAIKFCVKLKKQLLKRLKC
jgi:hypothetical protein